MAYIAITPVRNPLSPSQVHSLDCVGLGWHQFALLTLVRGCVLSHGARPR